MEIYTCEEYTLSYYLTYNYPLFNLMKEKILLEQTPYLTVESESLHSLDWFIDIVMKMKRIIEIAIGLPLEFDKMIAESPAITWEFDDERTRVRPLEVVHALTRNFNKTKINSDESNTKFLFNLNELSEKADFSHWQKASTIIEPVIELYIDDLYNQEVSASRHFLNMIQALHQMLLSELQHTPIIVKNTDTAKLIITHRCANSLFASKQCSQSINENRSAHSVHSPLPQL
nr:hypothetical protein [Paenibacillus odorifer]